MTEKIERIPTYINGIDKGIEGGIPEGFVNLICGIAGTMKSSIIFNIIYNEARQKKKNALYVSIEQPFDNFAKQLSSLNIDISKVNIALTDLTSSKLNYINKAGKKAGTIVFLDIFSLREKFIRARKFEGDLLTFISNIINKTDKTIKCDYFVMDALDALYAISEIKNPRETLYNIFQFLRLKALTSYLILETTLDDQTYRVEEYLADSVIFVDLARYDRIIQREILIRKMRATKADVNVFTLDFKNGKFTATQGGKIPILEFGERQH